ncbi:glycerol-3-phosphate cytidylyltransferase [Xenorhabdus koppenhoeferi]|uniref:Glycerol-3-phosphate cytidylyltransferase n=1 Tax=Xenorhabdus koppenhoeferi TaxID=351659 RepID=A0A1I7JNA8_9GAMM|nr:Glycerol-3-phosphate cytidylyltransferase [Xenorhabdus koppenhoeferi]
MKKVITYGTYDLFHVGHIRLLKRLKALGDYLIVVISTDDFNRIKGKKSFFSYNERKEIVESCKYVDMVIPENTWEQKRIDIISNKVDILGMGDDWTGHFDDLKDICEVIYLKRTENISTTKIKNKLSIITPQKLQELEKSVHNVFDIVKTISEANK